MWTLTLARLLRSLNMAEPDAAAEAVEQLLECARYGELDEVRQLLAGGLAADAADDFGRTALFFAAANGHADVVQLLLAQGAVRGCGASAFARRLPHAADAERKSCERGRQHGAALGVPERARGCGRRAAGSWGERERAQRGAAHAGG